MTITNFTSARWWGCNKCAEEIFS